MLNKTNINRESDDESWPPPITDAQSPDGMLADTTLLGRVRPLLVNLIVVMLVMDVIFAGLNGGIVYALIQGDKEMYGALYFIDLRFGLLHSPVNAAVGVLSTIWYFFAFANLKKAYPEEGDPLFNTLWVHIPYISLVRGVPLIKRLWIQSDLRVPEDSASSKASIIFVEVVIASVWIILLVSILLDLFESASLDQIHGSLHTEIFHAIHLARYSIYAVANIFDLIILNRITNAQLLWRNEEDPATN